MSQAPNVIARVACVSRRETTLEMAKKFNMWVTHYMETKKSDMDSAVIWEKALEIYKFLSKQEPTTTRVFNQRGLL